jgi:hypothetical protein
MHASLVVALLAGFAGAVFIEVQFEYRLTRLIKGGILSTIQASNLPEASSRSAVTAIDQHYTTGALASDCTSGFSFHQLNHTGDQIIAAAVTSATCSRLCGETLSSLEDLPVYNITYIGDLSPLHREQLRNPPPPRRFIDHLQLPDYLKLLRVPRAWDTSLWHASDARWSECNYICEIPHAFVGAHGHVCSLRDRSCFIPEQCTARHIRIDTACDYNVSAIKRYAEVVVITQFGGAAFFHGILETSIKLGDALQIVQSRPHAFIHVPSTGGEVATLFPPLFSALGIDPRRLVSGVVLADRVFVPRGTACGRPSTRQLVKYREIIRNSACYRPDSNRQRRILLVSRMPGTARSLTNHNELRARLVLIAETKGYEFEEFNPPSNNKGPAGCSIVKDMMSFERSSVIVAPHGAGLSNAVLCKPNTTIVEIQASNMNPVFMFLSLKLGLRHFIQIDARATSKTPITANVTEIIKFLESEL